MNVAARHIGLNLIFLVPGQTGGMEVAARQLIPALIEAAPAHMRFTAFINREAASAKDGPWGELLPAVTVPANAASRPQWVLAEQLLLPAMASRMRVDLMHSLGSTAPGWATGRRITTVHDLIYAHVPEAHNGIRAKGMRVLVPLAVRRSHRVITDSESTKRDLVELLNASPERIDVVPLGYGTPRDAQPMPADELRTRLDLGNRRLVLSLSAKRPHKNLLRLIEALAAVPPPRRPVLVLPGYPTWHEGELRQRTADLNLKADIRFLDWTDAATLEGLWAIADAFVYPSLYEGFGLPVLEAMARGVPVACSDASSLPEVAGEAALLFDPRSEQQIATAIERLLGEPQLAQRLRQAGLARAARFTWERSAQLTLESYMRALAESDPRRAS